MSYAPTLVTNSDKVSPPHLEERMSEVVRFRSHERGKLDIAKER